MIDMKKFCNKKWKCMVCGAIGKKWQTSWKANRAGRQHIYEYHNGKGKLSILKRDSRDDVSQGESQIRKKSSTLLKKQME